MYPDEVAEVKADAIAAAEAEDKTSGGDSNAVETPAPEGISMRNAITVPNNCPPGFKMGADGVCREVF